jgi:cytochrome c-type biogenesis protein CcmH
MITLWILAAGLLALAIAFVVAPLLAKHGPSEGVDQDQLNLAVFRQQLAELDADLAAGKLDQTQYKAARRDLERELIHDVKPDSEHSQAGHRSESSAEGIGQPGAIKDRLTALILALALPAGAVGLYLHLGEPEIIPRLQLEASGPRQAGTPAGHPAAGGEMPSLDVLVERLARKMEQNPEDLTGWLMLGRTYFATNQPDKALAALEKAYGLAPDEPEVLLAYAQAVAANSDGSVAGRPAELIDKALAIDPRNVTGRWLRGLVDYQATDYAAAVERWEAILVELDPQSGEARELVDFIAEARTRGGLETANATPAAQAPAPPATPASPVAPGAPDAAAEDGSTGEAAAASLTIQVSLSEALLGRASPEHTLFVYAKAVSGPPMPLAVQRLRASDLPARVTLDDGMAMMPAMRLSNFPEVTVGARLSASGQATPASGDLEGEVSPVKPGQPAPVAVVIDRVRP